MISANHQRVKILFSLNFFHYEKREELTHGFWKDKWC